MAGSACRRQAAVSEESFPWGELYLKMEIWELVEQARRAGRWPYPEPGQP